MGGGGGVGGWVGGGGAAAVGSRQVVRQVPNIQCVCIAQVRREECRAHHGMQEAGWPAGWAGELLLLLPLRLIAYLQGWALVEDWLGRGTWGADAWAGSAAGLFKPQRNRGGTSKQLSKILSRYGLAATDRLQRRTEKEDRASIHPSLPPSIPPSLPPSIHPSIHPTIQPSNHPFIRCRGDSRSSYQT